MNGYILLKDGTYKRFNAPLKMKYKNKKVKAFLIESYHPVFGFFYVAVDYKIYLWFSRIQQTKISYSFLDGIAIDYDDDEYLFVKNKYWYNSISDVFSKMMEIYINENIFNDSFWVYDSFFQYIYNDLILKFKRKDKKKKITMSGSEFFDKIRKKQIFKSEILLMNDSNEWKTTSIKKNINKNCMVQLYRNIYFRIDNKIFKHKNFKLSHAILVHDPDDADNEKYNKVNERNINNKFRSVYGLDKILESYVSEYVIPKLENNLYDVDIYAVVNKISFNTKKKRKYRSKKFKKFVRKYFLDITKF